MCIWNLPGANIGIHGFGKHRGRGVIGTGIAFKTINLQEKVGTVEDSAFKEISVIKGKPNLKSRKELPRASLIIYLSWH